TAVSADPLRRCSAGPLWPTSENVQRFMADLQFRCLEPFTTRGEYAHTRPRTFALQLLGHASPEKVPCDEFASASASFRLTRRGSHSGRLILSALQPRRFRC